MFSVNKENINIEKINMVRDEIKSLYDEHCQLMKKTVQVYFKIGEKILEAKELVGHGNFTKWVDENLSFGMQRAADYMNVFKHKKAIEDAGADYLVFYKALQIANEAKKFDSDDDYIKAKNDGLLDKKEDGPVVSVPVKDAVSNTVAKQKPASESDRDCTNESSTILDLTIISNSDENHWIDDESEIEDEFTTDSEDKLKIEVKDRLLYVNDYPIVKLSSHLSDTLRELLFEDISELVQSKKYSDLSLEIEEIKNSISQDDVA